MANIPCITTVQGLGAAVQGIEALERGDIGVRSLQDWALRRPDGTGTTDGATTDGPGTTEGGNGS
jgi:carbamoyl-phosphate synthase large subunit